MADTVHGFDDRGARRITDAVRWVEGQDPAVGGAGRPIAQQRDGWLVRPVRITDTAPTSDGLLTGVLVGPNATPMVPSTWVDGETVWVVWPGGSDEPSELPVNTFGELRIYAGVRLTEVTSAGTRRALYMVTPSTVVVPVYLANLTPTTGYHDAAIDPEGGGIGSSSTCWAKCINSGGAELASFGPYIGLLSGKVTNSGSERPRVLFAVHGLSVNAYNATEFVDELTLENSEFEWLSAGTIGIRDGYVADAGDSTKVIARAIFHKGILAAADAPTFVTPIADGAHDIGNGGSVTTEAGHVTAIAPGAEIPDPITIGVAGASGGGAPGDTSQTPLIVFDTVGAGAGGVEFEVDETDMPDFVRVSGYVAPQASTGAQRLGSDPSLTSGSGGTHWYNTTDEEYRFAMDI